MKARLFNPCSEVGENPTLENPSPFQLSQKKNNSILLPGESVIATVSWTGATRLQTQFTLRRMWVRQRGERAKREEDEGHRRSGYSLQGGWNRKRRREREREREEIRAGRWREEGGEDLTWLVPCALCAETSESAKAYARLVPTRITSALLISTQLVLVMVEFTENPPPLLFVALFMRVHLCACA